MFWNKRQRLYKYILGDFSLGSFSSARLFGRRCNFRQILSAQDITDQEALFIADPFVIKKKDTWFLFFEIMSKTTGRGSIGVATSSDGVHWQYQKTVLALATHVSYPNVFVCNGKYFMLPETLANNEIALYEAIRFPYTWKRKKQLIVGEYVDPSIIFFQGRWWLFAGKKNNSDLCLFFADKLEGPWRSHPKNPIVQNVQYARPAGNIVQSQGSLIRFGQDCRKWYGRAVYARKIERLSVTEYRESPVGGRAFLSPALFFGAWNRHGMHHVSVHQEPDQCFCFVDGFRFY